MRVSSFLLGALAFCGGAQAQCTEVTPAQFAGTPFNNSLTLVHSLSNKTFFKIRDPSGQHTCTSDALSDFSLLTYLNLNTTKQRLQNNAIKRVVIVVAGANANAWDYHSDILNALQSMADSTINPDSVAVVAPYFPNDSHAKTGFPYNASGTTADQKYPSSALVWYGTDWSGGANNQYPPRLKTVSSFDALDQLAQYYGNKTTFPNLQHIVVAGHSMGAQMLHRYVAVGKTRTQLGVEVPISYYLGNPSSSTWFSDLRPLPTSKCASTYNDWKEGLSKYTAYGAAHTTNLTYNSALLAAGSDAVLANWRSKTVAHGRAIRDRGDYSEGLCAPYTSGQDRHERFFKFAEWWQPTCADPAGEACHTIDFVNTTHNDANMFKSSAGLARLFKDNFKGDGSKAYDIGYPRHQAGDDPYPDPSKVGMALTDTDTKTYAGNKTHRGCFTDVDNAQSVPAFTVVGYNGTLNTRTYCANVCTQKGYTIAGLRDADCFCGNAIGSQSIQVVTSSCENVCPGDSSFCGSANRTSVLSSISVGERA